MELALAQLRADGPETLLSPEETTARQVTTGRVYERMWDYLTHEHESRA